MTTPPKTPEYHPILRAGIDALGIEGAPDVAAATDAELAIVGAFEYVAAGLVAAAGKRGKNRPPELAEHTPATLRGAAVILKGYAAELAAGHVPGVMPEIPSIERATAAMVEGVRPEPAPAEPSDAATLGAYAGVPATVDAILAELDPDPFTIPSALYVEPGDVYAATGHPHRADCAWLEGDSDWPCTCDHEPDPFALPSSLYVEPEHATHLDVAPDEATTQNVEMVAPAAVVPGAVVATLPDGRMQRGGHYAPGLPGSQYPNAPENDPKGSTGVATFVSAGERIGYRSVSQVETYSGCGMRYRLERVQGVKSAPAWWNVGGTATHEAIREWETNHASGTTANPDAAAARWRHHWAQTLAQTVLDNTGWTVGEYRSANKGIENKEWWLDHGPEMFAAYVTAQEGREYEIYRVGGDALALELGFTITLGQTGNPADDVRLKGFIDQILYYPTTGDVTVRDLKFGRPPNDGKLQLPAYRVAAEVAYGIEASTWWGDYWLGRKGAPSRAKRIEFLPAYERLTYEVTEMDRAERAGIYLPNPSSFCGACGVKSSCPVFAEPGAAPWRMPVVRALASVGTAISDAPTNLVLDGQRHGA